MIGIGLTLDDLEIDTEPGFRTPRAGTTIRDDREQYDFTLHRLAFGSWRAVREGLLYEAKCRSNRDLPLWFLLHWGEVQFEDEASIKERLSVLRYPLRYRDLFDEYICSHDDPDAEPDPDRPEPTRRAHVGDMSIPEVGETVAAKALEALMGRFPAHEHEAICIRLLNNPHLDASLVSVAAQLLANQAPWHLTFVIGRPELPADVIDLILGMNGANSHPAQERLVELAHLEEQTLLALIGKCDRMSIRAHPNCTQSVRDEIERLAGSDVVLSHRERREAATALDWARRDLASGAFTKTGKYFSLRERLIAEAVQVNPEIGLYEINELLNTHIEEDDDF